MPLLWESLIIIILVGLIVLAIILPREKRGKDEESPGRREQAGEQ